MKIHVLAIGKPKLSYAAAGIEEYERRLQRYAPVTVEYIRARDESSSLLSRSRESYRIALDERGSQFTTLSLSERITRLEDRPDIKNVSFLIGGSDGHSSELRNCSDEIWSLSAMTMQHELALVVLLEQLYRAYTIKRGEPYHRA